MIWGKLFNVSLNVITCWMMIIIKRTLTLGVCNADLLTHPSLPFIYHSFFHVNFDIIYKLLFPEKVPYLCTKIDSAINKANTHFVNQSVRISGGSLTNQDFTCFLRMQRCMGYIRCFQAVHSQVEKKRHAYKYKLYHTVNSPTGTVVALWKELNSIGGVLEDRGRGHLLDSWMCVSIPERKGTMCRKVWVSKGDQYLREMT